MFNIVIVEDEELERRALRRILDSRLEGAQVIGEARNGNEAVALLDTRQIDLMLLDIRIPRPNGIELMQMVRDRGLATKIIILTAYDHFDIMKEAIHLKADEFLLKPIRTEDLLQAVRGCLGSLPERASAAARAPVADRVGELIEANDYRECLALLRQKVESIYAREGVVLRREVRELLSELAAMIRTRGLDLPRALERRIAELDQRNLDLHSHFQVQELVFQIADVLFEVTDPGGAHAADRIAEVLNYIERNLHKGVTLEDAAEFARISPCYLSRLFRKEMDTTFIAYVKAQRIERAKVLLRDSDLPVGNVSLDLSFSDANYFCKAFKKEVGLSPSEYRRQAMRERVA
ncbi:response regulator [Salipiger bermudensis]|uniref:response regulator n=1 Tax=Salipiger bermudensis TaxID=344736 RepID=UPI001C9A0C37|nr:response regulator [Salipiger bermudensis]MBY6003016.1 response regulator [Salipiger bermudensis]